MTDNREYELDLNSKGINLIAGVDEVGRGPIIGPVVSSCVVLPKDYFLEGLTDSKKLSKKKREKFYDILKKDALGVGIGIVDEKIIDEINILNATKMSMDIAIKECLKKINIEHVLIDAVKLDIDIPTTSIIKGDLKSISIAAASVIAKVTRDNIMEEIDKEYPEFDLKNNNGYPTKKHIDSVYKYGITKYHRRTFKPVSENLNKEYNSQR